MIEIHRIKQAIKPFVERKAHVSLTEILELAFITSIINEKPANQKELHRLAEFFTENIQGLNPKIYIIEDFITFCLNIVYNKYNVLEIRERNFDKTILISFTITKHDY